MKPASSFVGGPSALSVVLALLLFIAGPWSSNPAAAAGDSSPGVFPAVTTWTQPAEWDEAAAEKLQSGIQRADYIPKPYARMSLLPGFSGRQIYFKADSVIPMNLSLNNPTEGLIEGTISLYSDNRDGVLFSMHLKVEPKTLVNLVVPFEYSGNERSVRASFDGTAMEDKVTRLNLGPEISNLQPLEAQDRLVVAAANFSASGLFQLNSLRGSKKNRDSSLVSQLYCVGWSKNLILSNPLYFSGVDAVIIEPGFPMTAETARALEGYARSGGNLVFLPCSNEGQNSGFKDFPSIFPWTIAGMEPRKFGTSILDISTFLQRFRELMPLNPGLDQKVRAAFANAGLTDFLASFEMMLVDGSSMNISPDLVNKLEFQFNAVKLEGLGQADTIHSPQGWPMVVHRGLGRGRIWVFTPDHVIGPWLRSGSSKPASLELLSTLRGNLEHIDFHGGSLLGHTLPDPLESRSEALRKALESGVLFALPGIKMVALFLGLYIFLGVILNHLVMRKTRRPETAWIFLIILSVLFSGGILRGGMVENTSNGSMTTLSFRLADPLGETENTIVMGAIFSTSRKKFDVFGPELINFRTFDASSGTAGSVYSAASVSLDDQGLWARDLEVRQRSLRFWRARAFSPRRPFVNVKVDPGMPIRRVSVENVSPSRSLVNFYVHNGRAFAYSGQNPGESDFFAIEENRDQNTRAILPAVPENISEEVYNSLCRIIEDSAAVWEGPLWISLHEEEGVVLRVTESGSGDLARKGYTAVMVDLSEQAGLWRLSLDRVSGTWERVTSGAPGPWRRLRGDGTFWFLPPSSERQGETPSSRPGSLKLLSDIGFYRNFDGAAKGQGSTTGFATGAMDVYNFNTGAYQRLYGEQLDSACVEPLTGLVRMKLASATGSPKSPPTMKGKFELFRSKGKR